jgi:hypothetical protein
MIKVMKELYPQFFWFAFNYGIVAGSLVVGGILAKRPLSIPGPLLLIINFLVVIISMILSVFIYRKKQKQIDFTTARELSFLVFALAAIELIIFRSHTGYWHRFHPGVVLFGFVAFYGLGRGLSYLIAMEMYKPSVKEQSNATNA